MEPFKWALEMSPLVASSISLGSQSSNSCFERGLLRPTLSWVLRRLSVLDISRVGPIMSQKLSLGYLSHVIFQSIDLTLLRLQQGWKVNLWFVTGPASDWACFFYYFVVLNDRWKNIREESEWQDVEQKSCRILYTFHLTCSWCQVLMGMNTVLLWMTS